jgi:ribulose 1,5-bisphosphate carboxylase large subunit-like protein
VCSHLDPMEPTGTRGVHGYNYQELVAIATNGDVLVAAGGGMR